MPKLKTHSGTKDRIRITKNGKVLHSRPFTSHLLSKKGASRKRSLAVDGQITGRAAKSIKLKLGA